MRVVLELLRAYSLYTKFKKCEFWLKEVKFLGQVVYGEGVTVDSSKIDTVQDWKQPKNAFDIWSFIGLARYYCHFVKDFSRLASPLTRLTRKGINLYGVRLMRSHFKSLRLDLPLLQY